MKLCSKCNGDCYLGPLAATCNRCNGKGVDPAPSQDWSPEPWVILGDEPINVAGDKAPGVLIAADGETLFSPERTDAERGASRERFVACVNACASIPTDALEAGVIAVAIKALRKLIDLNHGHCQPGCEFCEALAKLETKP